MTNQNARTVKKSISAAQRKKDPHAGPHGSFPLDRDHLKAAWDLAGHAANPDAVRAKVIAYARAHGMLDLLPDTAKAHMKQHGMASGSVSKATGADMSAVMHEAFHSTLPHSWERRHLLQVARDRHLLHHLPSEAHTDLHEFGIRHNHPNMNDGITPTLHGEDEAETVDDPDDPAYPFMHEHQVVKAIPKATFGLIQKSWAEEGSDDQFVEGWMSTPDRDLEKDITEPEAFLGGPLKEYFSRSAPLSLEHGTDTLPAGHLQKGAILRDGRVLETASHPVDAADFAHLPTSGSGVWVRGRLTEEPAKSAVRKGNVGGMSFTGNFTRSERLPGGGRRLLKIDPLLESTVAAYPVNPKAAMQRVQKALGLDLPNHAQETPHMDDDFDFDAFMQQAYERAEAKRQAEEQANTAQKGITPDALADLFAAFQDKLLASVDEKVQKAFNSAQVPPRGEGVGRKGTVPAAESQVDAFEADPVNYLIKKSNSGEELTVREKEVAGKLWNQVLLQGMSYESNED